MAAIRLRDLADRLGLDISTVSRALRNDLRVQALTRELVQAEAARQGYRPNASARALALGRSNTVWFLIPGMHNPVEREPALHAGRCLLDQGYDLMVVQHYNQLDVYHRLLERLATGAADGALIIPPPDSDGHHEDLALRAGVPLVFMDRHVEGVGAPVVTSANGPACAALLDGLMGTLPPVSAGQLLIFNGFEAAFTNSVEQLRAQALAAEAKKRGFHCQTTASLLAGEPGCLEAARTADRAWVFASAPEPMIAALAKLRDLKPELALSGGIFDAWSGAFPQVDCVAVAVQDFAGMANLAVELILAKVNRRNAVADLATSQPGWRHELPIARITGVKGQRPSLEPLSKVRQKAIRFVGTQS